MINEQITVKQEKSKNKGSNQMLFPTLIMGLIAVLLIVIGASRGQNEHVEGLSKGFHMTITILPMLIFAFIAAGMIQVLVPHEILTRWIGKESGIKGIFIGTVVGALTPGGPYVSLPIAAGLLRSGAGVGVMVAFLTGWSLWAVQRLPMDIGIMGWKFAVIRFFSTFFFPPIAGIIAHWIDLRIN
jgi:uncharacterized membrane protein YraQ (UPF0718 family)